ncbi:MAG: signal peptidase I [Clostridiales bacterium]|nr:signal peptidase I [Clostridiales bacterium]
MREKVAYWFDWIVHIVIAFVLGLFVVRYVFQITIVNGNSMERYLHNGNRLIMEKFVYKVTGIKRGNIIIINKPRDLENERSPIIKRVVGIAGDLVEIKNGGVYINGEKIDEPYINGINTYPIDLAYQNIVVPEGYVYVLGDNRLPNESLDSRTFGPINLKKVEGRAVLRFYPFSQFEVLK